MPENQKLNSKEVKEKIKEFLNLAGPSLPINVAKHLGMNTLFASAFLSEMASEGIVKISDMKVGGSPLYYTPEKIEMLENFIRFLGGKEKEACNLLKEKQILENSEQHPAIRVALRSLKDFAFPLKSGERIFWRYFKLNEAEAIRSIIGIKEDKKTIEEEKPEAKKAEINSESDKEIIKIRQELEEKQKELEQMRNKFEVKDATIEKEPEKPESPKPIKKAPTKKHEKAKIHKKPKIDNKFLEEIKQLLASRGINLVNIDQFDKKQVFAKIMINNELHLLAAYDKKKIDDQDLIKAYRKASSLNIPYTIFSKGELSKKTQEAVEAYKKLAVIEKIQEAPKPEKAENLDNNAQQ